MIDNYVIHHPADRPLRGATPLQIQEAFSQPEKAPEIALAVMPSSPATVTLVPGVRPSSFAGSASSGGVTTGALPPTIGQGDQQEEARALGLR
ncbi:hypothetical protein [Paractinoplanes atraurantiacus]|uniref:hypothetical protein n=1 Tax=Paractinoplanes atraurantiacus TaxID=1036182 RepID=UPI000BE39FC6|nr:hypothetical protein [Actinoplanes atraurantiacus]